MAVMYFGEILPLLRAGASARCVERDDSLPYVVFKDGRLKKSSFGMNFVDYAPSQREVGEAEWELVSPPRRIVAEKSPGSFESAIALLEDGCDMTRSGWGDSGRFVSQAESVDCGDAVELDFIWLLYRPSQGTVEVWHITSDDVAATDWKVRA